MTKTTTNNFKFSDILDGIINNDLSLEQAIEILETVNTSYSRNIISAFMHNDLAGGIALLRQSSKFEMKVNSVAVKAIILSDEDILARRDNLMLINGLSKEEATLLAYRRADRLKQRTMTRTTSIESGTYLL